MYLVSNPQAHKYESVCGVNINNRLIISILLGLPGRSVWKQKQVERERDIGFLNLLVL